MRRAVTSHPRLFENNRYVYPVLSRRSGGISIGINLNPDKICNFDCIYCQVDRTVPPVLRDVDEDRIIHELEALLGDVLSGRIFQHRRSAESRTVSSGSTISLSRATASPQPIPGSGRSLKKPRTSRGGSALMTSRSPPSPTAPAFTSPRCSMPSKSCTGTTAKSGPNWRPARPNTTTWWNVPASPSSGSIDNLKLAARRWPLVIQSLFMRVHGEPPPDDEILAFCNVLSNVLDEGGQLKNIQIYTVARKPAESYVTALTDAEVDRIAEITRQILPGIPVESYYGV